MDFVMEEKFSEVPLHILSPKTRECLRFRLDQYKVCLSSGGLRRDWRGLADIAQIGPLQQFPSLTLTETLLKLWERKGGTIQNLLDGLEVIDRYDIIDDVKQCIKDDIIESGILNKQDARAEIYSNDGLSNTRNNEMFHALVLHSMDEEGRYYAGLIIYELETKNKLKLFVIERDLVVGSNYSKLDEIAKIMKERCSTVILVFTPKFLQTEFNGQLTAIAQNLSIENSRRILIPCMFGECERPLTLSTYHYLDYSRAKNNKHYDFWKKLRDSITSQPNSQSQLAIKELPVRTKSVENLSDDTSSFTQKDSTFDATTSDRKQKDEDCNLRINTQESYETFQSNNGSSTSSEELSNCSGNMSPTSLTSVFPLIQNKTRFSISNVCKKIKNRGNKKKVKAC